MKRRATIKHLTTAPIAPARARELVDIIASHFSDETTDTLIELIAGIADFDNPGRDDERADAALNALMQAFTFTGSFYNTFCDYLAPKAQEKQR